MNECPLSFHPTGWTGWAGLGDRFLQYIVVLTYAIHLDGAHHDHVCLVVPCLEWRGYVMRAGKRAKWEGEGGSYFMRGYENMMMTTQKGEGRRFNL
jgi:hypothetical protein